MFETNPCYFMKLAALCNFDMGVKLVKIKYIVAIALQLSVCQISYSADSVAKNNKALQPPLVDANKTNCEVELQFRPTPIPGQSQHAYLVVDRGDGEKTEIRGGPQRYAGLDDQPSGNPFQCETDHKFGVVVPYIGKHGELGLDDKGNKVFSPDGNVANPTARIVITDSIQNNMCELSNCLMGIVKAHGMSCKKYIIGVAWMRNSNTIVSEALTSCGVKDLKPSTVDAPGWEEPWNR